MKIIGYGGDCDKMWLRWVKVIINKPKINLESICPHIESILDVNFVDHFYKTLYWSYNIQSKELLLFDYYPKSMIKIEYVIDKMEWRDIRLNQILEAE
jgi:hypothetical protein